MTLIQILYIIGITISISAALPQIKRLITTKASDEFSLTTWAVWFMTQSISLAYSVSIHNALLIGANVLWVLFYGVMAYLIVHYRHFHRLLAEPITEEA